MANLPEHIRVAVRAYIASDEADIRTSIEASGKIDMETVDLEAFTKGAIDQINSLAQVTDARPMTDAEIDAFHEDDEGVGGIVVVDLDDEGDPEQRGG